MKQETIHIEKLSIGYPGKGDVKVVASDICAGINSGELTCLLGANGVGKSTLLRTLSAFQPKLSGEIRIQGKEIGSYTDKQLSKVISVVLTEKCYIRNMTSVELIGLGRSPYTGFWGTLSKEDKEVVDHAINLVGISHLAHRMVHTLSDGERQKVMIAKALATDSWNWNWEISEIRDPDNILLNAETMLLANGTGGGWLYFYYKANATEGSKATLVLHNTNGDNPDVEIELTVPDDASTTA